jgi:hypothetical protein
MAAGPVRRAEDVPRERMVVIRICAIADMAFTMAGGRLTKFDRAGLAGRSQPTAYAKMEAQSAPAGETLIVLHTDVGERDVPESYLLEASGRMMRTQSSNGEGEAYLKCAMGTPPEIPSLPAQSLPP